MEIKAYESLVGAPLGIYLWIKVNSGKGFKDRVRYVGPYDTVEEAENNKQEGDWVIRNVAGEVNSGITQ